MKQGFTLIELILTIVLVGILAGVSAKILLTGLDSYGFIVNRSEALQKARMSITRLFDEFLPLRNSDLTRMEDGALGFLDRDGFHIVIQRLTVGGIPTLFRGADMLASYATFLDFDYLGELGQPVGNSSLIRRINVEFSIQALGGAGSVNVRTETFLRKFMYEDFQ